MEAGVLPWGGKVLDLEKEVFYGLEDQELGWNQPWDSEVRGFGLSVSVPFWASVSLSFK